MPRSFVKQQGESRMNDGGEDLVEFLKQAPHLADAVLNSGARYDRYAAKKHEWERYANRKNRLSAIKKLANAFASSLSKLDIISRDELASRVKPNEIEALVGSLHFLSEEATDLASKIQEDGRPRNLARDRWILELAEIFEKDFRNPARVWGSADGAIRGDFYRLLVLSRPGRIVPTDISIRQINK